MKLWQWVVMHAVILLIAALVGFAVVFIIQNQYLS